MWHQAEKTWQSLVETLPFRAGQAEKVAPLANKNDHTDPGSKSDYHGHRDELDHAAHSQAAHEYKNEARHQCGQLQTCNTELGRHSCQNHHEGAGWARDLDSTATEQRHDAATDNGGVESLLRSGYRGNRKCHCQGKCHDSHDDTSHHVA